ncbi:LytTR family transcriptional regulator DNA-binding domain-containing protein [Sporosarcina limicola]|uniref:ABC-2 type transport system ATP-binding protein n=1 Tax=Sporosarcina limicola TaxID=34101 RepID=A0A927MIG8_9BACL|nr:LytTR family transcriptional regulator DNA-binding domain-containing protein [Sporosarcina limicola]MBE1555218.1 ABC-2 type transport system ATP-binding protein [Sporosarcina limicola]
MPLQFINAEKRINDTLLFPSFDLSVQAGNVVAIHSSVNVREQLLDLLLGKTLLSNGEIRIAGSNIISNRRDIGFLFLDGGLYDRLTVEETLTFFKRLHSSSDRIEDIIRTVQLESKRKVKTSRLSYSEKKRVQFACLLLQNPAVYLFEEPDQNLDIESKRIFITLLHQLRSAEKSVLILTGNMESAVTAADEIYRLDENGLHTIQIGISEESLDEDTSEITDSIQPVRFEKIPTKVNEKIVLFDPPEIDYIESNDGQSFLHIKGESFPSVFTLNELEERLLPFGFFRCHRSYIVNLQKVREVITWTRNSFSLVLDDAEKSTIPLSKTKMADLKVMLGLK